MAIMESKTSLLEWRALRFQEMQFEEDEAKLLAATKDDHGFDLDTHRVQRMLEQGCSHNTILRIFGPLDEEGQ